MIWLWIAVALLSAGAAVLMARRAAQAASAAKDNPALAVYRRQMAEVDNLAERGLIAEADRRSVRAETGRRLLAAAERHVAPIRAARPAAVMAVAAVAPLAAFALYYLAVGAPGFADQPFAARLKAWEDAAESNPQALDPAELAAVWRAVIAKHPSDPVPLREFARAALDAGQPGEAAQALHQALALAPGRADLWDNLGLVDVALNQGEAGAQALADFRQALALDPADVAARYYLAQARIAGGDVAGGLAEWRALEAGLAPDDPRKAQLAADIREVAATGRLTPEGPSQAAASVGPAQIQAMVDGLAQRLAAHPDDPDGWVRLVRAYQVLGETDRRDAALAEARRRYAGRPDILSQLNAAAVGPR